MSEEPPASVVIVGASAAGLGVAEGLRSRGYDGAITMIGEEDVVPYDRPPLSKQVLAGRWEPERASLFSPSRLEAIGARLLRGRQAVAADLGEKVVMTDDGAAHPYDALVIATGVKPRTLPGESTSGVHLLRTLDDALALRRSLEPGTRLAIVGAGFLGLEVAATARGMGADVVVVEPLTHPLASRLGARAASRLLELHAARGVQVMTSMSVARLLGSPRDVRRPRGLELHDGRVLHADVVLVAIGCTPAVDWLAATGLEIDDGVVCDEHCSAAPGVWAAGDVARWLHVGLGCHIRLEHRMNATEQGNAVAGNILGEQTAFEPVPFFWTDHYDVKVQVTGFVPRVPEGEVIEEDPETGAFVEVFHEAGRPTGAVAWNNPRAMVRYRRELETRRGAPAR